MVAPVELVMVKVLHHDMEFLSIRHSLPRSIVLAFGLIRNDKYDMCGSRNWRDGESSMRMTPLVSGVYPDVPPSGITFTVRRDEEIATALPPDWKRAFAGTIDMMSG